MPEATRADRRLYGPGVLRDMSEDSVPNFAIFRAVATEVGSVA
jgi:hypothetical protein